MRTVIVPTYTLWRELSDDIFVPVYTGASFNHATGWCYRAQPFGIEPEMGVFDVQRELRNDRFCRVGAHIAVAETPAAI